MILTSPVFGMSERRYALDRYVCGSQLSVLLELKSPSIVEVRFEPLQEGKQCCRSTGEETMAWRVFRA